MAKFSRILSTSGDIRKKKHNSRSQFWYLSKFFTNEMNEITYNKKINPCFLLPFFFLYFCDPTFRVLPILKLYNYGKISLFWKPCDIFLRDIILIFKQMIMWHIAQTKVLGTKFKNWIIDQVKAKKFA